MVSFSSTHNRHIPVMLMETIDNLKIKDNGIYIDGTLGLGGHSEAILQKIDKGLLIGIDRDKDSISFAKKRLLPNENFKFFNEMPSHRSLFFKEPKPSISLDHKSNISWKFSFGLIFPNFIDFVLSKYVEGGVEELDINRLSSLIELKYKSLHDGQKVLGDADNIKNTFINFQKHLY